MRWKHATAAGVLVGAFALSALAGQSGRQPAPGTAEPVIRIENSRIDLGTVKAGEVAVAVFTLHNQGDVPVRILKAKPS